MGAGGRCPAGKRNGKVWIVAAAYGHNSSVLIFLRGIRSPEFREANCAQFFIPALFGLAVRISEPTIADATAQSIQANATLN